MELWLLWWDYAIYRYLEVWCQLGDVLLDVRFVRGDVKIQPAGPVPTQIISPFGGTFLYLLKKISILQLASSVILISTPGLILKKCLASLSRFSVQSFVSSIAAFCLHQLWSNLWANWRGREEKLLHIGLSILHYKSDDYFSTKLNCRK